MQSRGSLHEEFLSIIRVVEIRATECNFHQLLHQTWCSWRSYFWVGGGENLLYAITSHQEKEISLNVVTGIIKVFNFDVYALLDTSECLSFVTPYVANQFEILPEKLCEPFCVSTPIGEPILAERVYRNCLISIKQNNNMADLVELDMVDFDVILGME